MSKNIRNSTTTTEEAAAVAAAPAAPGSREAEDATAGQAADAESVVARRFDAGCRSFRNRTRQETIEELLERNTRIFASVDPAKITIDHERTLKSEERKGPRFCQRPGKVMAGYRQV